MASLILGQANQSTISAGANVQALQITYNYGGNFTFDKFILLYSVAIDFATVRLVNTQDNKDVISQNTILASVGNLIPASTARFLPWVKIDPITITNGNIIQLFINNVTATTINANNLSLTLFGKYSS